MNTFHIYLNSADKSFDLEEVLRIAGLEKERVTIELSYYQAIALNDYVAKHSSEHDAINYVFEELFAQTIDLFPENITTNNYDVFVEETRRRVIQRY